ncbi:PREDICTED: trem-like transcript 4 protein [Myotis brandtii]|uniref:trem-like transcript 4 protein n=1 Tax=Myotis brandtii TaxID=109478 RepID=UPI000703DA0F|nr:PREDICTED: trem-like transcript 4 protein [Myotis brandtii]
MLPALALSELQVLAIVLTCRLFLNKGLVFSVLFVLLRKARASGSQGQQVVPEELHDVAGQTLSVRCQYSPAGGPYRQKTWCQQTSPNRCTRLVTSSEPRTAVTQDSRYTIWDVPDAGFFNISMAQLTERDSGFYWCGPYNSSENTITVLRNISLLVSPAPTPSPMWRTTSPLERTVMHFETVMASPSSQK